MKWQPDLVLSLGSVTLRPYRAGDEHALYEAAHESVAEIGLWLPWCHAEYAPEESAKWVGGCEGRWIAGESYDFAVLDAATDRFCGGCSINQVHSENRFANLGYWVRTSETGRGRASEAARLVAAFGFEELDLQRLELVIANGNRASVRVAEKVGASLEGSLRNRLFFHGDSHDALMYSLVPEDLRPWRRP